MNRQIGELATMVEALSKRSAAVMLRRQAILLTFVCPYTTFSILILFELRVFATEV